jgi:hypothetical protein
MENFVSGVALAAPKKEDAKVKGTKRHYDHVNARHSFQQRGNSIGADN